MNESSAVDQLIAALTKMLDQMEAGNDREIARIAEHLAALNSEPVVDITDERMNITSELAVLSADTIAAMGGSTGTVQETPAVPAPSLHSSSINGRSASSGLDVVVPTKWDLAKQPELQIRFANHQHRPRRLHIEVMGDTASCQFRFDSQVMIDPTDDLVVNVPCNYAAHTATIRGTMGNERHFLHVRITEDGNAVYERQRLPFSVPPIRQVRTLWSKNLRFTSPKSFSVRIEMVNEGNVDLQVTPVMTASFIFMGNTNTRYPYLLAPIDIPWRSAREASYDMSCPAGFLARHFSSSVSIALLMSVNRKYIKVENGQKVLPLDRRGIHEMVRTRRLAALATAASLVGFVASLF